MPKFIEKENIIESFVQQKQALSTKELSNMPESDRLSQVRIEEAVDKLINEEKE